MKPIVCTSKTKACVYTGHTHASPLYILKK